MQTAQRVISDYRRRRLIVCILFTTLAFVLTLTIRFITERQLNEQRVFHFGQRAVSAVETLLSPFDRLFQDALPLMLLPCENVQARLQEQTARAPTVRSISLVKNSIIYCSSVFGSTHYPIQRMHPRLPIPGPVLLINTDNVLSKGSPILMSWQPVPVHSNNGIIQVINLGMLTGFVQYSDGPWVEKTILNIAESHFEYAQGIISTIDISSSQVRQDSISTKYPFSITTVGPSPTILALNSLPSQLPLAMMLSLLAGLCAWFMTAKRMTFSHEIHMGLASREFETYCQPLIKADTGECAGIELLLRWHNPRQGEISPESFIPLAEQLNLIVPLTCFVLQETVKNIEQLPKKEGFHISLNVAARHFKNGTIIEDLRRYWFPAHPPYELILELTERDALPEVSHHVVRDLHHLGVRLAIDDFGTGHSSLAYLETLNPDILKIDKSFTAAIGTDTVNSKVTDMIIALGHRLDIELIAEGVETLKQADFLRQQGVLLLQGYLYAKPMPLTQFPYWLENHNRNLSSQRPSPTNIC